VKNTMKVLALSLCLAVLALPIQASPPPMPTSWVPVTPMIGCTVDTETEPGVCRLFHDTATDTDYLVFWDSPNSIKFIRSQSEPGNYIYLYKRPAPGELL